MNRNTVDKGKKFPKKKAIIGSIIILVIVAIIGTVMGYFSYVKSKIYTESNEVKLNTVEKKSEDDVDYKEVEGITNVLLVGTDGRALDEASRADSIIIATLDSNNKKIRLTSLFRDTLS